MSSTHIDSSRPLSLSAIGTYSLGRVRENARRFKQVSSGDPLVLVHGSLDGIGAFSLVELRLAEDEAHSYGAVIALQARLSGVPMRSLVVYEPPINGAAIDPQHVARCIERRDHHTHRSRSSWARVRSIGLRNHGAGVR